MITTNQAAMSAALIELFLKEHPQIIDKLEDRIAFYKKEVQWGMAVDEFYNSVIERTLSELRNEPEAALSAKINKAVALLKEQGYTILPPEYNESLLERLEANAAAIAEGDAS